MAEKGLGAGLGALLGEAALEDSSTDFVYLPISKVETSPNQPRKQFDEVLLRELADSIAEHGILQPLTVRKLSTGYYQIIAGERRWRAARMAGLTEVPVRIIEADDKKATELALVENLQRADLNPMEEAEGYRTLMEEYGFTQEQVSERVGKSRSAVANALRLLALPEKLRALLETGELTPGHARAVLQVKGASAQEEFARLIVRDGLSVRKAEAMAAKISKETEKSKEKKEKTSKFEVNYIAELEKQLTECLGRRVKVVDGRKRGRLEIDYYGDDDLQTLIDMLTSKGK
ncbi:MAG TPA: ParB/RepB/Spo0J family partition protein [Clostridiales bacterium]|jgi:ParB family chromosome partitioning protein|nr:ParB/RepB/Spo0J family partition protein [Clostridiales bacterium]